MGCKVTESPISNQTEMMAAHGMAFQKNMNNQSSCAEMGQTQCHYLMSPVLCFFASVCAGQRAVPPSVPVPPPAPDSSAGAGGVCGGGATQLCGPAYEPAHPEGRAHDGSGRRGEPEGPSLPQHQYRGGPEVRSSLHHLNITSSKYNPAEGIMFPKCR